MILVIGDKHYPRVAVDELTLRHVMALQRELVLSNISEAKTFADVRRMLAEDPFRTLRPERPPTPGLPASSPLFRMRSRPDGDREETELESDRSALIGSAAAQAPLSLRELEIQHIERLLREHKNITTVAKLLEIDRRTLQRKLRSLGIDWRDEG